MIHCLRLLFAVHYKTKEKVDKYVLYGSVTASEVVERVCSEINDIEKLKSESEELLKMSGESGAASRLCEIALSNNESLTDRE